MCAYVCEHLGLLGLRCAPLQRYRVALYITKLVSIPALCTANLWCAALGSWSTRESYLFLAHLCLCTMGSYASLSVCPSLDQNSDQKIIHISQSMTASNTKLGHNILYLQAISPVYRPWLQVASHLPVTAIKDYDWQVGSHQCQVASFWWCTWNIQKTDTFWAHLCKMRWAHMHRLPSVSTTVRLFVCDKKSD